MPGVLRNENRRTLLNRMARIIENEGSATFNDVESFIHFEVSVNRDTYADQDLLGSHGETVGAFDGVQLPTEFELTVNSKTAKALDLSIPSSIVLSANIVE